MSWLSTVVKKNKKAILNAGRIGLAALTRGKSEKVIGTLKGVGSAVKVYKSIKSAGQQPKSVQAAAAKVAMTAPKVVPISSVKAETMPGGAPLPGVRASNAAREGVVKKTSKAPRRKAAARGKAPKAKSTRKPPTAGLDLKALSASWKKAGKPGKWIDWVKKNR